MSEKNLVDSSAEVLMSMKMAGRSLPTSPSSPSRPQRKRKKNSLIFNDDEITQNEPGWYRKPKLSPQKQVSSPSQVEKSRSKVLASQSATDSSAVVLQANLEKAVAKRVGSRLRNLLKLPKAHKMCMFEWFYSHLDSALFKGENDFCMCLKESFPELSSRKLTRAHWSKIRRLMGKPRRCSQAFFEEERMALETKRNKIRLLQQRKIACDDPDAWSDLPREIPMPLVVGTSVTARVRGSHDGLFTGHIDAVDICNASYRVTFDRSNLGTHLVSDVEVASCEPQETINLLSLMERKHHISNRMFSNFPDQRHTDLDVSLQSPANEHDPILGRSPLRSKLLFSPSDEYGGTLGGFPIQLLKRIARLSRILSIKREKIHKLGEMNSQAERANSYGETLSLEFQRKYATVVLELERLNKDLNELLVGVQRFCLELYPEQSLPSDQSSQRKKQCLALSEQMVADKNVGDDITGMNSKRPVKNAGLIDLITQLTALMMQIKCLKDCKGSSLEFKSLTDAIKEIKVNISTENQESFQNNVEIHIAHIRSGMEHNGLTNSEVSSEISDI